ncbi:hypothetical protein E1B28_000991 [Marasmius oreades]|uniref:Pentatricopeptide repeat-containing protein n=1 Tax=Marasmius oreades TaxID=181124 RepID=A0A9P8AF31_9AGAR|nr:uncharacterized protein E1B28_000991 [Marasmius oreades]KAG7099118.1 hypothetical protein E1B28_000991 [Marasmius oreades]
MLLRASPQASVILFDFLAPSLCRAARVSANSFSTSSSSWVPNRSQFANAPRLNYDPSQDIHPKTFAQLKSLITSAGVRREISEPEKKADLYNSILIRLDKALRDGDPTAALECWRKLVNHDFIPLIPTHDLKRMSQLVSSSLIPPPTSPQPLIDGVEHVAVVTAASRHTDALVAAMVFHIQRNDPDAVFSLYDRFKAMMLEKGVWEDSQAEERDETKEPEYEALASIDNSPRRYGYPGYIRVLLAVTTAHAMCNDLPGAVATCLDTSIRFHYFTNAEFLSHLDHEPKLREKVETYIRKLDLAKLLSRPPSFSRHILNLGNGHSWKLSKLYESVMEGIAGPDPFIAADPKLKTSKKLVSMTPVGFTSFLTAFHLCNSQTFARRLWEILPTLGITHDISMWNALLDASGRSGLYKEAQGTWDLMVSQGVQPDALTHRAMISAFFNGRRPRLAMEHFREFQSQCTERPFCPEDVLSVYNTVLSGLLNANRSNQANAFLDMMEQGDPRPDVVSYNTFLGHFTRQKDLRSITDIMDRMSARGVAGDTFTYSTILSALLKVGRVDATDLVLGIMEKQGIEPSVATYTAIIASQMREADEEHFRGALALLKKMEADDQLQPNAMTYMTVLKGVHRGNFLTPSKVEQVTDFIVKRIEQRTGKLGGPEYTTLIREWLEGEHPNGAEKAFEIYQKMRGHIITISFHTWEVLLAGLVQRGNWTLAEEVVRDMMMRPGEPPGPLMALVDQVRWRKREKRSKRSIIE